MKRTILILFFIISVVLSIFLNFDKINLPYLNSIYKDVSLDLIFNKTAPEVYFDNEKIEFYQKIDENHYIYKRKLPKKTKEIKILKNSNIENIIVYVGYDIQFIEKSQNIIKIDNEKTFLEKIAIIFLSFFYNFNLYLFSYLFLFLYLINFKIHINHKITFLLILFLAIFLRITQINHIPFWDDEIYILSHSANYSKLIELLQDPGNPPLYFILFKIWRIIVQKTQYFKFLSLIFGICLNIAFYFYLKSFLGKNKALIGFFISAISMPLIYYSQEIRCYSLLMFLAVLNMFYLFKFNSKNKFKYLISAILILYTHFYGAILVLYNFLFGNFIFCKNKRKQKIFLIINLILSISYLPLLIMKSESLNATFNSWMKIPVLYDYIEAIKIYTTSILLFLLFIALVIFHYFNSKNKKNKLFILYNFLSIFFVILTAAIFSHTIKPIFAPKYFYVTFPCYLALVTYLATYQYKFKTKIIFQTLILILFIITSKISYQNLYNNPSVFLKFINHDLKQNYNNYIFLSDTIENYKEIKEMFKNKAKIIYLPINRGISSVNVEKYDLKNPSIAYILNLYLDNQTFKNAKDIKLFKSPLGVFCKVEFNK